MESSSSESGDGRRLPFCPNPPSETSTLPLLAPTSFQKPFFLQDSVRNPSTSSDRNHIDHHGHVTSDADSNLSKISGGYVHGQIGCNYDPNLDPRKLRRVISNRISAQKSRMKKLQHVTEMERKAKALEHQIAALHPQIIMYKNQQQLLQMEQKRLSQEMSVCSANKMMRDAEIEENRAEVNRLRQLHLILQQQKMQMQEQLMFMNSNLWQSGGTEYMFMNTNTVSDRTEENNEAETEEVNQQQQQAIGPMWLMNPNDYNINLQQQKPRANSNSNSGGIEQILSLSQNPPSCLL